MAITDNRKRNTQRTSLLGIPGIGHRGTKGFCTRVKIKVRHNTHQERHIQFCKVFVTPGQKDVVYTADKSGQTGTWRSIPLRLNSIDEKNVQHKQLVSNQVRIKQSSKQLPSTV
jgi:hypothetical protein